MNSSSYLLTSGHFLPIDRIPCGKCFEIVDIPWNEIPGINLQ